MKEAFVFVDNLEKTFKLSKKQQKIERTKEKKLKVVNHLSFYANQGEVFGLLGANGAGKTTTLRMLATLIKPDNGTARIMGYDILKDSEKVRENIGFLSSELKLDDFFTPNYLFDFYGQTYGMSQAAIHKRKNYLFEKFGVDKFAEVKIGDLSTGMKQKISLVISIVNDPMVLIFDEPTNGLDIMTTKIVTDFLLQQKAEGKTIILSTHIFELIERVCDRVGIIQHGQMLAHGTLDEIRNGASLEDRFFEICVEEVI